mmetsp:Transcript_39554/g.108976  ORF Transcript_39554/g.108976 Transcript_39554/m.108976 type:complete len:267 (-) Transcript_39554:23-823(-)
MRSGSVEVAVFHRGGREVGCQGAAQRPPASQALESLSAGAMRAEARSHEICLQAHRAQGPLLRPYLGHLQTPRRRPRQHHPVVGERAQSYRRKNRLRQPFVPARWIPLRHRQRRFQKPAGLNLPTPLSPQGPEQHHHLCGYPSHMQQLAILQSQLRSRDGLCLCTPTRSGSSPGSCGSQTPGGGATRRERPGEPVCQGPGTVGTPIIPTSTTPDASRRKRALRTAAKGAAISGSVGVPDSLKLPREGTRLPEEVWRSLSQSRRPRR